IVGVLAAVVAAFFYIRIVVVMFAAEPEEQSEEGEAPAEPRAEVEPGTGLVLVACAAVTLLIGILPGTFVHFARDATFLL
ncbi:MAG: hypothetical protein ACT4PI_19075, partial [Actinomycetota bacterium]